MRLCLETLVNSRKLEDACCALFEGYQQNQFFTKGGAFVQAMDMEFEIEGLRQQLTQKAIDLIHLRKEVHARDEPFTKDE